MNANSNTKSATTDLSDYMKAREDRRIAAQKLISAVTSKTNAVVAKKHDKKEVNEWGSTELTIAQKLTYIHSKRIPKTLRNQAGGIEHLWRAEFMKKFPDTPQASVWEKKEVVCAASLILLYSLADASRAVEYFVRYWEYHRPRFFKGSNKLPTISLLRYVHAQIVPESQSVTLAFKAKEEFESWIEAHKGSFTPMPDGVRTAYDKALPLLKGLGIG